MRWARGVVAEYRAALIRNVPSLLTATTHVMVAGTDADPIAVQASKILLDVTGTVTGIAMVTLTIAGGDAAIATAISTAIGDGAETGKSCFTQRRKESKENAKSYCGFLCSLCAFA